MAVEQRSPGGSVEPESSRIEAIVAALWRPGDREHGLEVAALLDGAQSRRVLEIVNLPLADALCLFRGEVHPRLRRAAPHLVALAPCSTLTRAVLAEGWGRHWAVFVRSKAVLHDLLRHFRKLLVVQDERGRRLFFRFYDPRVLAVYLPTCNAAELATVFGPVEAFLMEGDDPGTLLELSRSGDKLSCRKVLLEPQPGVLPA